jgi:hypothetical protein
MADDPVTIDPEFAPRPSREPGRGSVWMMTVAVAVAAFVFGYLLRSPVEIESAASTTFASDVEASSSTSASTGTTIGSVVSTIPRASSIREMVLLQMPLSDAVPGFTDTVVLLETPSPGFNVLRWRASERRTEVALSGSRADPWPVGLDASGTLLARVSRDGGLIVTQVPDIGVDPSESEWEGMDVVVETRWHDTRPGALALLSCPPSQPGVATLHTWEVSDGASRPLHLRSFDQECGDEEENVWVERWDNEGVWIRKDAVGSDTVVLIDADGSETPIDSGLPAAIEPFQIDGEDIEGVSYSPDGALVALVVYLDPFASTGTVRVVNPESGVVLAEVTEPGSVVFALAWSTDGRFVVFEQVNSVTGSATLVFYDTATTSITTIPIADVVDEIRTAPAS